jgi:hypothetical protein
MNMLVIQIMNSVYAAYVPFEFNIVGPVVSAPITVGARSKARPFFARSIVGSNPTQGTGVGRAIAQAVSRRLPTAARVQTRVWSCGIL